MTVIGVVVEIIVKEQDYSKGTATSLSKTQLGSFSRDK